jgi:hypothetical protein
VFGLWTALVSDLSDFVEDAIISYLLSTGTGKQKPALLASVVDPKSFVFDLDQI